jgi:hypothetical protein
MMLVDLGQVLAHGSEHAASVSWHHVVPIAFVGAAFLLGIGLVGRERRRDDPADPDRATTLTRWSVIGLLLAASVVHIPAIPSHLEEAPYMGVLFILFTLAAFGVATALAASPSRLWYLVTSVLCGAAVLAYVATRLFAFPQLASDVGLWAEPLGLAAISAETFAVVFSVFALRHSTSKSITARPMALQH